MNIICICVKGHEHSLASYIGELCPKCGCRWHSMYRQPIKPHEYICDEQADGRTCRVCGLLNGGAQHGAAQMILNNAIRVGKLAP